MSERAERCDRCRFWQPTQDGSDNGYCLRYPPVPLNNPLHPGSVLSWWPETAPDEWCGEFQSAEPCTTTPPPPASAPAPPATPP